MPGAGGAEMIETKQGFRKGAFATKNQIGTMHKTSELD